jgi:polar amino acid transport system substrate-binding protein
MKTKINAFLEKYRSAGNMNQLADRYLAKERDMMKAQGIPFLFDVKGQ